MVIPAPTALARTLQRRGHQVVIFGIADCEARVRAAGVEFYRIGAEEFPLRDTAQAGRAAGRIEGACDVLINRRAAKNTTTGIMFARAGGNAFFGRSRPYWWTKRLWAATWPSTSGLPLFSIAMFPPLIQDDRVPPFCFGWATGAGLTRLRNELDSGYCQSGRAHLQGGERSAARVGTEAPEAVNRCALKAGAVPPLPEQLEFDVPGKPAILH